MRRTCARHPSTPTGQRASTPRPAESRTWPYAWVWPRWTGRQRSSATTGAPAPRATRRLPDISAQHVAIGAPVPADIFGDAPPRPPGGAKKPRTSTARANALMSVIDLDRVMAVASDPDIYALSAELPERAAATPGRPGEFPLYIYLLFNALTAVFHSARATAANLANPLMWSLIREGITQGLGQAAA